ncbi:MAG TPA: GxxExxY protein [Gemmatimonadales bacterium]|nr:GxxExxY protein [Gemmatimonadales bacterium]
MRHVDQITNDIIHAAIDIHRNLGPGLLESVYESILQRQLERRGYHAERQKPVSFDYEGLHFDGGLFVDLLVEQQVVVELKSVERLAPVYGKQLLTYLRVMKLPVGLLINFGAPTIQEGLKRIVHRLPVSPESLLRVNQPPTPRTPIP